MDAILFDGLDHNDRVRGQDQRLDVVNACEQAHGTDQLTLKTRQAPNVGAGDVPAKPTAYDGARLPRTFRMLEGRRAARSPRERTWSFESHESSEGTTVLAIALALGRVSLVQRTQTPRYSIFC